MGGSGGRADSDKELFSDEWVRTCRRSAGNITDADLVKLGDKLRAFAEPYRKQIASIPSRFPSGPEYIDVSEQRDWIERQVLKPIGPLKNALQSGNRHYFKGVMFDHSSSEPDFENILRILDDLENYAEAAFIELDYQASLHIPNTSQLQFELVNGIVNIIEEQLGLYKGRATERANFLVRKAFAEITGCEKKLDDDIKSAVKRVKEKSGGNEF